MTEPTYTIEQIEQAHMAGQADAGVDPSYSNAQAYVQELTRPAHQFREGEVVYIEEDIYPYKAYDSEYMANSDRPQRPLRLSEMPAAVSELRQAVAEMCNPNRAAANVVLHEEAEAALTAFDKAIGEE